MHEDFWLNITWRKTWKKAWKDLRRFERLEKELGLNGKYFFCFFNKRKEKCFKGNYFFASFEAHAVWGQFSAQKHPCATSALDIWKRLKKRNLKRLKIGIWKDLK